MPLGIFCTKLYLDNPKELYYGSEKEITGRVVVGFVGRDATIPELFGPLEVTVLLEGRAKTKIIVRRNKHHVTYRGRVPLLALRTTVQSGATRIANGKSHIYPFKVRFPERIQNLQTEQFDDDPYFDMSPSAFLPPSMFYKYTSGFLNHRFECFVEYRVRMHVNMPGIDVPAVNYFDQQEGCIVSYEQPRVPGAIVHDVEIRNVQELLQISNEYLLPEDQRPAGFRAKTAAFFKSNPYPTFVSLINITGSANLILGEPIKFDLHMRPDIERSTATELPEIKLKFFSMTVKSSTLVRAEVGFLSRVQSEDREKQATLLGMISDTRPFSKANDYTKTITMDPLVGLPSTFSTKNITRTYTIGFEMTVFTAEVERRLKFKDIPIRILSSAMERGFGASTEVQSAGPSQASAPITEETLPVYQPPDSRPIGPQQDGSLASGSAAVAVDSAPELVTSHSRNVMQAQTHELPMTALRSEQAMQHQTHELPMTALRSELAMQHQSHELPTTVLRSESPMPRQTHELPTTVATSKSATQHQAYELAAHSPTAEDAM